MYTRTQPNKMQQMSAKQLAKRIRLTAYRVHASARGMEAADRAISTAKRSSLPILLTKFHRLRDDRMMLLRELIDLVDQHQAISSDVIEFEFQQYYRDAKREIAQANPDGPPTGSREAANVISINRRVCGD